MNIFRKKIDILYFSKTLEKEDAKKMVQKIPYNFPNYFKSIPKNMFNPVLKKFNPTSFTIKSCPGFINLYKRSLLVTLPYDIYLTFNENKILSQQAGQINLQQHFPSGVANMHENEQLLSYVTNTEYKFIIKISLPFYIDSNVSLLMSPSSYHFNNFEVLSGIINPKYKRDMNFFIPIKKNQNEFFLKKGHPLFLFTPLCENKIKLNFKKLPESKMLSNLTFSTLKQNILKNLT